MFGELEEEARFVCRLQHTRSDFGVDAQRRADDDIRKLIKPESLVISSASGGRMRGFSPAHVQGSHAEPAEAVDETAICMLGRLGGLCVP
jgi:hypothetical protein